MTSLKLQVSHATHGKPLSKALRHRQLLLLRTVVDLLQADHNDGVSDEFSRQFELLDIESQYLFLSFAADHRFLATFTNIIHNNAQTVLDSNTKRYLKEWRYFSERKNAAYIAEAVNIQSRLDGAGVPFAFTKGIVWQQIYRERGQIREFSDVDIMVAPDATEATQAVLESLGYRFGATIDSISGKYIQLPRAKSLIYKLYPDHLPPASKFDTSNLLPSFDVDVAFSFTWFHSSWQYNVGESLARRIKIPIKLPSGEINTMTGLDSADSLLFGILHLFREAWFLPAHKEIRLPQFVDCAILWDRLSSEERLILKDRVFASTLQEPVAWIAYYIDQLLERDIVESLGLGKFCDPDWLCSALSIEKEAVGWNGRMSERLVGLVEYSKTTKVHPAVQRATRALG